MNLFEFAEELKPMEVTMLLKKPHHSFVVVQPVFKSSGDEPIKEAKIEVFAVKNNP